MRFCLIALALALSPVAAAAQSQQLLAGIESRLPFYQVDADVSQLSLQQAAAIHLTLASSGETWIEKRRRIRAILRQGEGERR